MIDYDHSANLHTAHAPECIAPLLLKDHDVQSVLDIGCGTGVWLKEFSQNGIKDIYGIDGIDIGSRDYLADKKQFQCLDLSKEWDLSRTFDLAVCLEVAEHLPPKSAAVLVEMLCKHANLVLFSAACPSPAWPGARQLPMAGVLATAIQRQWLLLRGFTPPSDLE